jgi:hypothetical protein
MSLERQASKQLVDQLTRSLGHERVIDILQVTLARFKSLSEGRGRLADGQLANITKKTGKFWMLWGVDASEHTAATSADRDFIAYTRKMVSRIDPLAHARNGGSSPVVRHKKRGVFRQAKAATLRRSV